MGDGGIESLSSFWQFGSFGLKGQLPPEIGGLGKLRHLEIGSTELSGPIPPELGDLGSLRRLSLYNTDLSGPIPSELGDLGDLGRLDLNGNQLSGPVPLVAGRRALLRVFPTAATGNSAGKPAVRARFYVNGRETRVVDVASGRVPCRRRSTRAVSPRRSTPRFLPR